MKSMLVLFSGLAVLALPAYAEDTRELVKLPPAAEENIRIARRTVAKYREQLKILRVKHRRHAR